MGEHTQYKTVWHNDQRLSLNRNEGLLQRLMNQSTASSVDAMPIFLKRNGRFFSTEQGEFRAMNHCLLKPWAVGVTLMQSVATVALENVPAAYLIVTKSHHVSTDILYVIALTKSGMHHRGEAILWPWALNIDGQSVFCESQQDAVYRVSQAIQHEQSVDTGLMQVNWRWHRQRFSTIDESLVPIKNLSAGASILYE